MAKTTLLPRLFTQAPRGPQTTEMGRVGAALMACIPAKDRPKGSSSPWPAMTTFSREQLEDVERSLSDTISRIEHHAHETQDHADVLREHLDMLVEILRAILEGERDMEYRARWMTVARTIVERYGPTNIALLLRPPNVEEPARTAIGDVAVRELILHTIARQLVQPTGGDGTHG